MVITGTYNFLPFKKYYYLINIILIKIACADCYSCRPGIDFNMSKNLIASVYLQLT